MKRLAVLLGTIIAAHTALELARDTLFLERVSITHLPWVYLLVAAVSLCASRIPVKSGASRLAGLLFVGAAGTATMALLPTSRPLLYVLYVWTGVIASLSVSHFWAAVASRFSLASAKRFYASIGFGGLAGAIAGATMVRAFVEVASVRWVMVLAAGLFAVAAIASHFVMGAADALPECGDRETPTDGQEPVPVAYVRRVAFLLFAGSVTVTLLDFAFKRTLVDSGVSIARMASNVAVAASILSALVQLFVLPRLLKRFSVTNLLMWLPSLVLLGAASAFLFGATALVLTRLGDMMLRFSLHKTATELLFLPMGSFVRAKVKSRVDVMPQRVGQAIAGGVALLTASHWPTLFLVVLASTSIVWLVAGTQVCAEYVALIRERVRDRTTFSGLPQLDVAAVEALVGGLSSADDREVLAALDVLEQQGKPNLVPTLLLHHPSQEVVLRTLDIFTKAERREAADLVERLLAGRDAVVRAHALRALSVLSFDEERSRRALHDSSAAVRLTALVSLRDSDVPTVRGDRAVELAFLASVRLAPHERFAPAVASLAREGSLPVQRAALETMLALPHPSCVPIAIELLAVRALRPLARQALVAMDALEALRDALSKRAHEERVLIHIPRTISRFEPQRAVPILLDVFENDPDGRVRHKALRGLGRIATDHGTRVDERLLDRAIARTIKSATNFVVWRLALQSLPATARTQPLMLDVTQSKLEHAIERIFRLLELRDRSGGWQAIYHGLRSGDPKEREASLELFSSNLPLTHAAAIALIDPTLGDRARREELRGIRSNDPGSWDELVAELRSVGGRTLRSLAVARELWKEAS